MDSLPDLPLELYPLVLQHLIRPTHIAQLCLINRDFYAFSIAQLYRRIFVYAWHKNAKNKVVLLFQTLARSPHLARYVEELTIRDFPVALLLGERIEFLDVCVQGLRNCVNLKACTWTRYGSLSADILRTLSQLPLFDSLEINGKCERQYRPDVLLTFTHLRKLCLIMPSNSVVDILSLWLSRTGPRLRTLSLICKDTPRINDTLLGETAPFLTSLEHLHLLGCSRVTHTGLWDVVSRNEFGLLSLGIEALSPAFDMVEFSLRCRRADALRRLRSITLTVNQQADVSIWRSHLLDMLSESPLELFHISAIGGDKLKQAEDALTDDFIEQLVSVHGQNLRRFSVQRMPISVPAIKDICARCVKLEQLFIVVDFDKVDDLGSCLALTHNLRSLHVNRPLDSSDEVPVVPQEKILALLRQSGSNITQIGFSTRVWKVQREVTPTANGDISVELKLGPYEHPEIPEQFLVLRA